MRHEKGQSLLRLAQRLASSSEGMTLDEMALFLGTSRRTAERMRDSLRTIFPQMEDIAEGRALRFRIPGGLSTFMQTPTADELADLDGAAAALSKFGDETRARSLSALADKIRAALRGPTKRRLEADVSALRDAEEHVLPIGPRPVADPDVLTTVRAAIKGVQKLRLLYEGAGARSTQRIVEPFGLIYGKAYYLVAAVDGKKTPALWRLDRIAALEVVGPGSGPPKDFDLGSYAGRSFGIYQEEQVTIRLIFSKEASGDAARFLFHPGQALRRCDDGTLEVEFTAGGLKELAWHLVTWGPHVTVVEPEALRSLLVEIATEAAEHHSRRTMDGL